MMSTICPQLETVVSSRDMLSRVGRWSLIASPCLRRRLRAAARSLLAAGHFPQSLIHTIWFNSNPVAFFYVCPSRFTGSHIASEIRDSQQPCTRFRTVELLVDLRRRKSGGAPPPCMVLQSIHCHSVTRFPSLRMVFGSTYTVCSPRER